MSGDLSQKKKCVRECELEWIIYLTEHQLAEGVEKKKLCIVSALCDIINSQS